MRILNLQAENIKKLTAIDITPQSEVIMITGPNGAGKSSVLDCITMALKGGREIPEKPIKSGADKGKIVMDLGAYQITRSFTKDNTYLKIEGKDGTKIESPQKFLNDIVGNISFDPLEFLNNETKKQKDILLGLVGVDVNALDQKEKELRDNRTIIGRDVEKAKGYKSLPFYPEAVDLTEESVADLATELQSAIEHNAKLLQETNDNEAIKTNAMNKVARIKELNDEVARLTAEVDDDRSKYKAEKERLAAIPIKEADAISDRMSKVESTNAKVRANKLCLEGEQSFKTLSAAYESCSLEITNIINQRTQLLSSAAMPIAGLAFDDNGLTYNSIPLSQCSDGEKLMVSLAISMALNPTLRVLRIKDGSLLDERNRAIISQACKDKDYQLWYESVGTESKVGILIEEGEIVSVDGKPVDKKKSPPCQPCQPNVNKEPETPAALTAPETSPTTPISDGTEDW